MVAKQTSSNDTQYILQEPTAMTAPNDPGNIALYVLQNQGKKVPTFTVPPCSTTLSFNANQGKTTFRNSKDKPTAVLQGSKFGLETPFIERKGQKRKHLEEPKDIICLDTPTQISETFERTQSEMKMPSSEETRKSLTPNKV